MTTNSGPPLVASTTSMATATWCVLARAWSCIPETERARNPNSPNRAEEFTRNLGCFCWLLFRSAAIHPSGLSDFSAGLRVTGLLTASTASIYHRRSSRCMRAYTELFLLVRLRPLAHPAVCELSGIKNRPVSRRFGSARILEICKIIFVFVP